MVHAREIISPFFTLTEDLRWKTCKCEITDYSTSLTAKRTEYASRTVERDIQGHLRGILGESREYY